MVSRGVFAVAVMKLRPLCRRSTPFRGLCTFTGRLRVATVYGSFGRDRKSDCDSGVLREGWDTLRLASRFPSASISNPVAADELDFDSLAETDFLLVVTSSRLGFPPPNFTSFSHNLLLAAKSNPGCLAHLQHAVFGNGHPKWYATYMSMPRYVDQLLEEAGSRRFYARGEAGEPHPLSWPSNHPASLMRVDTSTPAVSVEDWALPMWSALAAAAEGLEAPPVAWDALWAKEASHKHHEVRCRGSAVWSECAARAVLWRGGDGVVRCMWLWLWGWWRGCGVGWCSSAAPDLP